MLTQVELKDLLHYDPDTGEFYWLKKVLKDTVKIKRAGSKYKSGYRFIKIGKKYYPEHRLVWLYVYGNFPDKDIDHINHIKDDNRLCNLREVTHAQNMKNLPLAKNNSSGVSGIYWCKTKGKYISQIKLNGKRIYQRSFHDINEAISQRKAKLLELGFHPNHGE